MAGYDVIGDVHGHAQKLEGLLDVMGYAEVHGVWQHPSRQAVFIGDLVDRGPEQVRTVPPGAGHGGGGQCADRDGQPRVQRHRVGHA